MPTTTKYIWDDDNYLAEAGATDTINVVYTNEPQQYGNLVSTRISSTTSYHHFDAIGSTREFTNAAGHVTDTMIYDAWGNVVTRTGTTGAMLLWIGEAGYYFDTELDKYWVRRRSFAPLVARWNAIDPSGGIDGPNWYLYVQNDPMDALDPSGLSATPCPPCKCGDIRIDPVGWQLYDLSAYVWGIPIPFGIGGATLLGYQIRVQVQTTGCCTCTLQQTVSATIRKKKPGSSEWETGSYSGFDSSCPGTLTGGPNALCGYSCWPDDCLGLISYRDAPGGTVLGWKSLDKLVGFQVELKKFIMQVCCIDASGAKTCTTKSCSGIARVEETRDGIARINGTGSCF
jgi:RHS repeat-associated protein